ncbi:GlsB/YeaQ/YmgE family stress response membrane protein [Actinophytocola sediminis]
MIGFLIAGLIIGALARLIKPGKQNLGILATLALGLVGSLIGGTIAWLLGTGDIWELNILGFILAVIAAVLLIGAAEAIVGRQHRAQGAKGTVPHR